MATYSDDFVHATTSENLISSLFDEMNALQVLKEFEKTIEYTKRFPPERVSENFKLKIYSLNVGLETLINSWQLSRNARKNVMPKIDAKLWENKLPLKYLFQEYIEEREEQLGNNTEKNLYCTICKMKFPNSAEYLNDHLKGIGHLLCFEKIKKDEEGVWDNLWEDLLQKCKYGRFFEYNGPNNNLFCKVCCVEIPRNRITLKEHVDGRPHVNKFETLVSFLIGDDIKNVINEKQFSDKKVSALIRNESIPIPEAAYSLPVDSNLNNLSPFIPPVPNAKTMSRREFLHIAMMQLMLPIKNTEDFNFLLCCCFCSYYSCTSFSLNEHLNSREHASKVSTAIDIRHECSCNVLLFCDSETFNYHVLSGDHLALINLFLRLRNCSSVRSSSDKTGSSFSGTIASNIPNISNLSQFKDCENSDSDDNNSPHETSDVTSDCSSTCVKAAGPFRERGKARYKRKRNRRGRGAEGDKSLNVEFATRLGLKDLPEGTESEEIIKATQHFGEIMCVNILEDKKSANLLINLKDEFANILDLDLYVTIKKQKVLLGKPIYNETFALPESVKLQYMSAERLLNLNDFLLRKSLGNNDFIVQGRPKDSKIAIIKRDLEHTLTNAGVIAVGSRSLRLASNEDATLDLFVLIDNNYYGTKNHDIFLLSRRSVGIYNMLYGSPALYSDPEVVGDEEQVVNFKHEETGLNCRIYCRDGLVVVKNNLIKTYLEYDGRVKKVLIWVRDWAKETGLAEVISQYAITWLVLFALMQESQGHTLLPPVIVLRNKNDQGRTFIAGWDCRFCGNPSVLQPPISNKSPIDLLKHFFRCYSNSSIMKSVCAPLTGEYLLKKNVRGLNLPPPYNRYIHLQKSSSLETNRFNITPGICLMDPLELNRNLTECLQGLHLNKFRWMCKQTLALMDMFA